MADYATLDQIIARLLPNTKVDADDPMLSQLVTAASRTVDSYLTVPDDFFAVADVGPTERTVYGTGESQMRLPPFIGQITTDDVTPDVGYIVPAFQVVNGWLVVATNAAFAASGNLCSCPSSYYVWQAGVAYKISAQWGWQQIPADINEACIQMVVRWYRGRDDAYAGVIAMESTAAYERALPVGAKTILDHWATKLIQMGILKD
jgi:hypothetical protein